MIGRKCRAQGGKVCAATGDLIRVNPLNGKRPAEAGRYKGNSFVSGVAA